MKPTINKDMCTGCGICANICPDGIEMIEGKAVIKDENAGCLKEAAAACPRRAILLGDEKGKTEEDTGINQDKINIGQGIGQGSRMGRGLGRGFGRGLGRGPRDGRGQGRGGGGRRNQ